MKTWFDGKLLEMYVGKVVTVYRCGEDHKEYGEFATLTQATKRHLIFTTDSGATVKTRLDCLHAIIGDAKEKGYCVSPKPVDAFSHMIHEEVRCRSSGRCIPVKQQNKEAEL